MRIKQKKEISPKNMQKQINMKKVTNKKGIRQTSFLFFATVPQTCL